MTECNGPSLNVEMLLSQDAALSAFSFEDFQVNLQKSISELQQRARRIRSLSLSAVAIFLSCVILVIPLHIWQLDRSPYVPFAISFCGVLAMFVAGILAAIYQYHYQPALARANDDLLLGMIGELRQQIAELRHQQGQSK